jgi:homogentisate 1,2-dioxygenase
MSAETQYQSGFGNEFASEAVPGALPVGQNAPQKHPLGLYTEQFSGTPFTAPRATNRRTWTYRIRPSVTHRPYEEVDARFIRSGPFLDAPTSPNQLRWDPLPLPKKKTDFVDGMVTLGGNGDPAMQVGVAIHLYAANASMKDRFFYSADGEFLIVPQLGKLRFQTELGILDVAPGEICVIPRGVKFRVEQLEGNASRGYICENYGLPFRLPELGAIGANGLANPRDFQAPTAAFDDREGEFHITSKFMGRLAPGCRRLARQLLPLQIRSRSLQLHQHSFFRPPGSLDLYGVKCAFSSSRHGKLRFRDLSAAVDRRGAHLSTALVSPQFDERVHGPGIRRVRCKS